MPSLLSTYALTTLQKVKDYLGITDTTLDTLIQASINQQTDFIESFCGARRFLRTTYTGEIYDSKPGRCIFLNNFPITSLTAVYYRGGTVSSPVWNTYSADGYLLYGNSGYVKFYAMLPEVSQGLKFDYVAGYLIDFTHELDTTYHTLPFDLTQACTQLVAEDVNTRQAIGLSMMATEGQQVRISDKRGEIPASVKAVLTRYQTLRYAI